MHCFYPKQSDRLGHTAYTQISQLLKEQSLEVIQTDQITQHTPRSACSWRNSLVRIYTRTLHGWKVKISKILNFWNSDFKSCGTPLNFQNMKFKWSFVFRQTKYNLRTYYNLPNSAFWGWLSLESQPQNPEFRNNPENLLPCRSHSDTPFCTPNQAVKWTSPNFKGVQIVMVSLVKAQLSSSNVVIIWQAL